MTNLQLSHNLRQELRILRADNRSWNNRTIEEDTEFRAKRRELVNKIIAIEKIIKK